MRSGVLTSINSRQRSATGGRPLPEWKMQETGTRKKHCARKRARRAGFCARRLTRYTSFLNVCQGC